MFCKNCGKEIPDNAVFCNKCGARTVPVRDDDPVNNLYSAIEGFVSRFNKSMYYQWAGITAIVSLVAGAIGIVRSGYIIVSLLASAAMVFLWYRKELDNKLYMSIVVSVYLFRFVLLDFQSIVQSDWTYAGYVYIIRLLQYGLVVLCWLRFAGKLGKKTGGMIIPGICLLLGLYEFLFILTNLSGYFTSIMACISDLAFFVAYIFVEAAEISRR